MHVPVSRYFRVLVVGEEHRPVAAIIERDLRYATTVVPSDEAVDAMRGAADVGAIVVGHRDAATVAAARDARGLRMPLFMFSRRDDSTLDDPVLGSVDGVLVEGLESRTFYEKRLQSAIERYNASFATPFFGALMP